MRVAVTYNLRREVLPGAEGGARVGVQAEYDTEETVAALCGALAVGGHQPLRVEAEPGFPARLAALRPDFVFNVAEGAGGPGREAQVPAVCELLGLPYTGSGVLALALGLDKAMTKRVLSACGVPTPRFVVVPPGMELNAADLRPPLFVKPLSQGSSMGVTPRSLVRDHAAAAAQVAEVHAAYGEPALVEAFLPGREFTIGILGNGAPQVLPIMEIDFGAVPPGYPPVYTYQFKREWDADRFYRCPAPLEAGLQRELQRLALAAYAALACRDVARVDLRLDAAGQPQVIEVNPLPGMVPGFSDLPRQAAVAGMGYAELVVGILDHARARCGR